MIFVSKTDQAMMLNNMKKVLLVGTSFSAAPLAEYIISLGWNLDVCGNNENDPCVSWAGKYHCLNYADYDTLLKLVKQEGYDALVPSCNDAAYLSVIQVAEKLGLPGFDSVVTTNKLHDKSQFRAFARNNGIPVPRIWEPGSVDFEYADYPLLVKPVDSFSGRGISKVSSPRELSNAITAAQSNSASKNYVVEQFLPGSLHSHSAFLKDQKIVHDFFVDEFCTVYPYQVNCSNSPSRVDVSVRKNLRELVEEMARLLQLADGLLHSQFIIFEARPYLIECMRRCPGDLFYHLVSYSTENLYVANYINPFIGRDFVFIEKDRSVPWARHTISSKDASVVYGYAIDLTVEELRIFQLSESGSKIEPAPFGKVAIIFTRFPSVEDMYESTERMSERIKLFTTEDTYL